MVWQLIKRDYYWQAGVLLSIVIAVLTAIADIWTHLSWRIPPWSPSRGDFAIVLSFVTAIFAFLCFGVYARRDLYDAALPLDGRDIWLSRLLAMLSVVWLPVPIAAAGGLPVLTLLAGASVATFAILCGKCFRVRELGTPKWFSAVLKAIFFAAVCLTIFGRANWLDVPSASGVFSVCGLASLLLFPFGWSRVPKSFSVAPLELSHEARNRESADPKIILAPVFRSIDGSWSTAVLFCFVVGSMARGNFGAALLAVIPLHRIFANCQWLLVLPFSRRKLFALVAAAPMAGFAVGDIAAALFHRGNPHTPQEYLIDFAVQLASVFLAAFLIELPGWRPLSGLRTWIKWIPFAMAFFVLPLLSSSTMFLWIAQARFPAFLFFLLPIPMYWLAEKAFMEQEYRGPLVPVPANRSWRSSV